MRKLFDSLIKTLKNHGLFLIIIILAAVLRFRRLAGAASFDFDQEYAANFAHSVVKEFPIQLIGQGLSVQGLFMGPLYFYYMVPFFILFKLHPIGGAVGSVVLALVTIFAYYYYASKIFNKNTGLIAAFLRAILFNKFSGDLSMAPAFSCEFLVLVTWYYFYQYWRGNTKSLPVLSFVFGLYTSFHPILFPFYLVFLVILFFRRILPNFKTMVLSFFCFLIPLSPLILFEYLHNFLEIKRLIEIFSKNTGPLMFSSAKVIRFLYSIFASSFYFLGFTNPPSPLIACSISVSVLLLILGLTLKGKDIWKETFHFIGLFFMILVFVLYYYFLPTPVIEYYFMAPFTLLFFYFAALLGYLSSRPKPRILVAVFLILISFINISLIKTNWANPNPESLACKDSLVKKIIQDLEGKKDFTVSYINLPGRNFGFDYLFKYYGYIPKDRIRDKVNYNYTIVIPKELSLASIDFSFGRIGLILP